jgi:hypothetical protein
VAGSRENHGFHAVVQNGPAASELSLPMRKTASWSGSLRPTEYKVAARMFVRDKRAPLDRIIPTTTSVLPCSVPSSLACKRRTTGEVNATARLDGPCARQHLDVRVGAKKWAFKSNKEIGLKEKIACREFSA